MVSRRVPVVKGLVAQVMAEAVDGERALLNSDDAKNTGIDQSAPPVTPAEAGDHGRQYPGTCYRYGGVVFVLPNNKGVVAQVGDIGSAVLLVVLPS